MKDKTLLYLAFSIFIYFSILFLNGYWLKNNSPIFSFLQETLTIPLLLALIALLFFVLYKVLIKKHRSWPVNIALFILIVTSIVSFGSLFGIINLE